MNRPISVLSPGPQAASQRTSPIIGCLASPDHRRKHRVYAPAVLDSTAMTAGEAAVGTAGISRVKAKNWDSWYAVEPAPWEIDRPQPVLVELAVDGRLSGRVLDVGCGSWRERAPRRRTWREGTRYRHIPDGDQPRGREVPRRGVRRSIPGRRCPSPRSARRDVRRRHRQRNVPDHSMATSVRCMRPAWPMSSVPVASSMSPASAIGSPASRDADSGPRRVSEDEIRTTFTRGWVVDEFRECLRERRPSPANAWLATIRRSCLCSHHDVQPD